MYRKGMTIGGIESPARVSCDGCGRRALLRGKAGELAPRYTDATPVQGWSMWPNRDGSRRDICPQCLKRGVW